MIDVLIYILGFAIGCVFTFIMMNRKVATGILVIGYKPDIGYTFDNLLLEKYTMEELAGMRKIELSPVVQIKE